MLISITKEVLAMRQLEEAVLEDNALAELRSKLASLETELSVTSGHTDRMHLIDEIRSLNNRIARVRERMNEIDF